MLRKLLLTTALVMLVVTLSWAQSPEVTASWTAPTEGSPVVEYELIVQGSDGSVITVYTVMTQYVFPAGTFDPIIEYVAIVRGKDAQDRYGPWSVPSDPYVYDPGPPGSCSPVQWNIN